MRESLNEIRDRLSGMLIAQPETGDYRINREVYTNPQIFDLEMQHIFGANWTFVAHESQIPNPHDFITAYVGHQPVLVSRSVNGAIVCMLNSCAHRGAVVCRRKSGNQKTHTCGFHGWTYDSRGRLRGIPDEERGAYPESLDKSKLGLKALRTEEYRGFVFATLNQEAETLESYLGGAKAYIDMMVDASPVGRLEILNGTGLYTYKGNWKLSTENGLDGYHAMSVHASYVEIALRRAKRQAGEGLKVIDLSTLFNVAGGFLAFENGHGMIWSEYPNWRDRPEAKNYDRYCQLFGVNRADWMVKRIRNLLLAPNVFLMDAASMQIRIVRPIAVDKTEVIIYAIAPVGESDEDREKRLRQYEDFYNAAGMATPDDVTEFSHCQAGYAASGLPWSDISRGATRYVEGGKESEHLFGYSGVLCGDGTEPGNEGIYVAMYRDWIHRLSSSIGTLAV